ncbi:plasmid recombination protein [Lachnospiraceae bacterium ZAX-1]
MADKSVVRNAQYRRGGLNKREWHNERKNADYQNEDIIKERAALNIHFKPSVGGYESTFDAMLAEGAINTRGLGKDPYIVDELVFDVNSAYFENNGGYEYAKRFFEEAYRFAVKEIGGEQYVLSAVMHADERNKVVLCQEKAQIKWNKFFHN